MQTQYEINDETMAILTIDKNYSEVYEMNEHYIVEQASNKIMEDRIKELEETKIIAKTSTEE